MAVRGAAPDGFLRLASIGQRDFAEAVREAFFARSGTVACVSHAPDTTGAVIAVDAGGFSICARAAGRRAEDRAGRGRKVPAEKFAEAGGLAPGAKFVADLSVVWR